MNIFTHFQHLTLTSDQDKVLRKLSDFLNSRERVFILKGYAGTGKTTLLHGLVQYLNDIDRNWRLMAPTGRAANVIHQKTGFIATTIHKGIYSFNELHEIELSKEKKDVSFKYMYKLWNDKNAHNTIYLVDEASMISDVMSEGEFFRFGSGYLLKDLIEASRTTDSSTSSKIIFIGDDAQLPPIGMNFSPALSAGYLKEKYNLKAVEAVMTEVKRQDSDNGILNSAGRIRKSIESGYFNDFDLRSDKKNVFNIAYSDFLEAYKTTENKKIVICYKNKTAKELNSQIRKDKYGSEVGFQKGGIVISGANNYLMNIMNGEFAVVSDVSDILETREVIFREKGGKVISTILSWRKISLLAEDESGNMKQVEGFTLENFLYADNYLSSVDMRGLYVDFKNRHPKLKKGTEEFKEAIKNDKYFNCLQLKYGYAVTCHKAQGGEWDNAIVFWDKGVQKDFNFLNGTHDRRGKSNEDFYRWAYTAVTRASEKLICINPPRFHSYSNMQFVDAQVLDSFESLTDTQVQPIEIEWGDELLSDFEKFGLFEKAQEIQDHFLRLWYFSKKYYAEISHYETVGYESRYIFKREKDTAAFMYWFNGKNEFNGKFQKIPKLMNSNELYDELVNVFDGKPQVVIKKNTPETVLTGISHDIRIEEELPFLQNIYNDLINRLDDDTAINDIEHLLNRERYYFKRGNEKAVIDFLYDDVGFFGMVTPIQAKCNSQRFLNYLKEKINALKSQDYDYSRS